MEGGKEEAMRVAAGEFKAKCLEMMDRVAEKGGEYIITKRGQPVAKLVPVTDWKPKSKSIFGCMQGTGKVVGDIISPLDVKWEANED